MVLHSYIFVNCCACRQCYHEQETDLSQTAGSARSPGLAVQEERKQRLPGHEMEEVLVCVEEDGSLLVHQPAGECTLPL